MQRLYIITGANGHLGRALVHRLKDKECQVRGFVLAGETAQDEANIHYYFGDVTKPETMEPLFHGTFGMELIVIHAAGIVDISPNVSLEIHRVNVEGTQNVIALCQKYKVKRLLYISSVHAIPEGDDLRVLTEIDHFAPEDVEGGYAKTKAEATQAVLDAAAEGLDAVVVHPSGILGPYDEGRNHVVQLVADYMQGRIPACVKGGYDFVDVRDVARGCLLAVDRGKAGECYILSNRFYSMKELLTLVRREHEGRALPVLPLWMAKMWAPVMAAWAKLRHRRPLYTAYSLYTLGANARFSHDKATAELGYRPRDMRETVKAMVGWLRAQ